MQRLVTLTRRSHHAVIRLFSSSPTASSLSRPSTLPVYNDHRSNAETLVNAIPAIEVAGTTALCEGGGGATGRECFVVAAIVAVVWRPPRLLPLGFLDL